MNKLMLIDSLESLLAAVKDDSSEIKKFSVWFPMYSELLEELREREDMEPYGITIGVTLLRKRVTRK